MLVGLLVLVGSNVFEEFSTDIDSLSKEKNLKMKNQIQKYPAKTWDLKDFDGETFIRKFNFLVMNGGEQKVKENYQAKL